jgi:hypothetical protein
MYAGFSGEKYIYMVFLKEGHMHIRKHENMGSYSRPGVSRVYGHCLKFFVFFFMGHFPSNEALVRFEVI